MTNATNNVARVAAAVAGLGLVAMSFAPLAGAQTTTTTTTTTTASFARDLTIGSTGADVTALQTLLIGKGFSIPAGATGYFGAQTKAALAAYQAANMISPAVGYFGPITRAKVNAAGGSTTGGSTGGSTSTGGLSGGEADLNNFDLISGDGTGAEGERDVEIATAEFDVDDADVSIQRVDLVASSTGTGSASDRPWDYFDTIMVSSNGDEIADIDASDRDNWDEGDDNVWTISLSGLDAVVDEGDTAEFMFTADIADNLDSTDISTGGFDFYVEDAGIRAVDAAGIQQYIGDDTDEVSFDFDSADNGDLTVRESSNNPDNGILVIDDTDTSDEYDVLIGEIRNTGDGDSIVTSMTFDVATSSGLTADLSDVVRRATLDIDGDTYRGDVNDNGTIAFEDINDAAVDSDDTTEFTLSVELAADSLSNFDAGDTLRFNLDGGSIEAEGVDTGDDATVDGAITGSVFTVSASGIEVEGSSNSSSATTLDNALSSSYGTYTIKFDVTAGDDDLYIPVGAATTSAASTTGVVYDTDAADNHTGTTSATFTSTADKASSDNFFLVRAGDTESFTLTVVVNPATAGTYEVDVTAVQFDTDTLSATALTSFDVSDNSDFQTNPVYISN